MSLEEIDNAEGFVGKLERIEPPGQMISFLNDPLLQKYVDLKPTPLVSARIDLWLSTCLEEVESEARSGTGASAYSSGVLDALHHHTQYTKVSRYSRIHLPPANSNRCFLRLSQIFSCSICGYGMVSPPLTPCWGFSHTFHCNPSRVGFPSLCFRYPC